MRCFEITWDNIAVYYCAETKGEARTAAGRTIRELYDLELIDIYKQMRCRRAKEFDKACDSRTETTCISKWELLEALGQTRLPFPDTTRKEESNGEHDPQDNG